MSTAPARPLRLRGQIARRRATAEAELLIAKGELELASNRVRALQGFIGTCDDAERVLATSLDRQSDQSARRRPQQKKGAVRCAVLQALTDAAEAGLPLTQITEFAGRAAQAELHPNTISMTLTRLRREGKAVKSDGRWRITDQSDQCSVGNFNAVDRRRRTPL